MESKIIVESVKNTLAAKIVAGNHQLTVDEPLEFGGSDSGPDPYALILGSLGACTVITLHMYAQQKQWPLQKVRVALSHHKIHAVDCEHCEEDDNAKLDKIERHISLSGPLSPEQIQRLHLIAQRCPVHKTLEAGIRIQTQTRPYV